MTPWGNLRVACDEHLHDDSPTMTGMAEHPNRIHHVAGERVVVRRSARRTRTVSAHREDGRIIVAMPQRIPSHEEERWLADMVARVHAREERARVGRGDAVLLSRAERLHARYLVPQVSGAPVPTSVTWVDNQRRRWGSCTVATGTIRLSNRLQPMPDWVVDYVLVHELTHLVEPDHTDRFWRLVGAYPRAEEAKGYLAGWADAMAARPDSVESSAGGSSAGESSSGEASPGEVDECSD